MDQLTAHYDDSYYSEVFPQIQQNSRFYDMKARWCYRTYFSDLPPHSETRILDYGCGLGYGIACCDNAMGYDVSHAARQACERRGIGTYAHVNEIPIHTFDRVLCRHVLEHVPDPFALLTSLLEYLTPEGRLILVVPREQHAPSPLDQDVHRHLFSWNFRSLNNLIHAAGGVPQANRTQATFGQRTDRYLKPLQSLLGDEVYFRTAEFAGRIMRQVELIVEVTGR